MAIWQDQFATQCKIKKAVILYGNVQDTFWIRGSNGISIKDYIVHELAGIGYSDILCWDKIDGARGVSGGAAEAFLKDATDVVAKPASAGGMRRPRRYLILAMTMMPAVRRLLAVRDYGKSRWEETPEVFSIFC